LHNYYEILGVKPDCTSREIKRSFRKKAKKLHPDLKAGNKEQAEDQMRILLAAYEVLSNPEKRSNYNQAYKRYYSKNKFNYRDFLKSRKHDLISQAKLIFHDLLNSNIEEALSLYEQLSQDGNAFDMRNCLEYEDYMDCLFLLAEAFEKKHDFIRACNLYKQLFLLEQRKPYFHHFIAEVIERLRNITCFKMVSTMGPGQVIEYIQELIDYDFSRKDNAFFYKKIAEIYCSQGQKDIAIEYLRQGLRLDQKLPGVKKLKEKIGFTEIPVG
jgi:tetratricopeptide (TPR) repeat protein